LDAQRQNNHKHKHKHTRSPTLHADVVALAGELLGCRKRLEVALHSGRARGPAATATARSLGWRAGQRIAEACADVVHLGELAVAAAGDDDDELASELRVEMAEVLECLAEAMVDVCDATTASVTASTSAPSASSAASATAVAETTTLDGALPIFLADSATSELADLMTRLAAAVAAAQPASRCHHRWVPLGSYHEGAADRPGSGSARVHNRGDGKGKYLAYRCLLCDKFQRRHSDLRDR
jgi:hypothetical protein